MSQIHIIFTVTSFLFILLLLFGAHTVTADENPINIETTPNGFLFNTDNLKPGDWIPREITISNDGKEDFKYVAQIGKSKSIKGLFEELDLLVQKEETTLFDGKLKDFTGFTPRNLAVGASETLFFEVTMPTYLDNSFQGSSAEVEIIFLAEGIPAAGGDPDPPATGDETNPDTVIKPKVVSKLPDTATSNFNVLLIGLTLFILGSIALVLSQRIRRNKNET